MHAQIDSLRMKDLKQFNVPFIGLKLGKHSFDYQIDKTFFDYLDFHEFENASLNVDLLLEKKSTLLELKFSLSGTVNVLCDVSLEPFDLELEDSFSLVVKFGEEFNDDNDEILILPHEEYQINVAQHIYELIVLAVPSKKVHPKVLDGTLKSDAIKKLKELEIKKENTTDKDSVDPRWDKLKNLITEKKT